MFGHFLRGPQPTFAASFLTLSVAGAILPAVNWPALPIAAGLVSLALLGVFAAGAIKVNRRVFWLTEERRAPRIFGFFPIMLLGGQFLGLFGWHLAPHVKPEWWGLGCILVAMPVLLTADTLARIFQQRTGDLVRPLPWAIGLPLGVGILLCVAGIALAGAGLRPPHIVPWALVPTAAMAAALMGVLAHRTGHRAFVWAMLLLAALAYNFSYVCFKELAALAIAQAAAAVQEQRLPIAFYGLTYLPLIFLVTVAGRWTSRRRLNLWAQPLQTFGVGVSALLLLLSPTHPKALLPVALAMTGVFALQAVAFRQRALLMAASIAWLAACVGAASFATLMFQFDLPAGSWLAGLTIGAWLLLWPGSLMDRWAAGLALPKMFSNQAQVSEVHVRLCQLTSAVAAVLGAGAWLARFSWPIGQEQAWPAAALLSALLTVQAMRWRRAELGAVAYAFTAAAVASFAITRQPTISQFFSGVVLVLLGQWIALYALRVGRVRGGFRLRLHDTFGAALAAASLAGLSMALFGMMLPTIAAELLYQGPPAFGLELGWPIQLLLCMWAFDAARQQLWPAFSAAGCTGLLGVAGLGLPELAPSFQHEYLPALWATLAVVVLPLVERLRSRLSGLLGTTCDPRRRAELAAVVHPIEIVLRAVLTLIASGTLVFFTPETRLAGGLAVVGLWWSAPRRRDSAIHDAVLVLFNCQLLAAVVQLACPRAGHLLQITPADMSALALPLAAAGGASLLAWRRDQHRILHAPRDAGFWRQAWEMLPDSHKTRLWVRGILRMLMGVMMSISLSQPELDGDGMALAGLAFTSLIASELWSACRRQSTLRVWIAEAIVAIAASYFTWWGVVKLADGWTMFAVLGLGLVCWLLSHLAASRPRAAILSGPLRLTSMALPLAAVAIGVWRHVAYPQPSWLGLNSLALLLAASFYFWQAIERGKRQFWLLSAAVLNIAVMLLWRELRLSDPQFYMIPIGATIIGLVQLLKRQIPTKLHDPLRYLGALTILVSPTFHIVGGSWLHLITLMTAAVMIVLVSIGLQVRVLMYTGTAFLLADLAAMLVRGSVDHPNLLWIAGLGLGGGVVALAALCEHNRERVLQRLRVLSTALQHWD